MNNKKLKLTFYGGTEFVTGANFLLESNNKKILVDCGLFQGNRVCDDKNRADFAYDPATVDILFITHGHLDHVGRIPKLVHDGFKGRIYSTPATKDLGELILFDSMGIMKKEAKWNKQKPFYEKEDVEKALQLWRKIPYHEEVDIGDGFKFIFKDAGHIMGSAMVEITYNNEKIVFTGDLGNSPAPILRDTEVVDNAKYIVMESVYGDRNHENIEERTQILQSVIENTIKAGGTLMIPAFSIERTQVLLFELNHLIENKKIPSIPIFLDSPLAIKATAIYDKYDRNFNKNATDIIKSGDDIFNFPGLKFTLRTEESKAINAVPSPKVIIAGSGMSNGGRIVHHEKRYLPDSKSTLLLIGYQAPNSMGRRLQDGAKSVRILGEEVQVRAKIVNIRGYSAHKDSDGLVDFVSNDSEKIKKVFAVMGEPKSSLFLVQKIKDELDVDAVAPKEGESFELEF